MTTNISHSRPHTSTQTNTERRRDGASRRFARRRRRVQRGVVASYLHDISARHIPTAPAV